MDFLFASDQCLISSTVLFFYLSGHSTTSDEGVLPQCKWISCLQVSVCFSTGVCIFLSLIVMQDFKNAFFVSYMCIYFLLHLSGNSSTSKSSVQSK